jgi:hypothetical protein
MSVDFARRVEELTLPQMPRPKGWGILRFTLAAQGLYCIVTGLWPLISIECFQLLTGSKTDHLPTGREANRWLVMTVGVLVTAIAVALLAAAWRRSCSLEVVVWGMSAALGLTLIAVVYVARASSCGSISSTPRFRSFFLRCGSLFGDESE